MATQIEQSAMILAYDGDCPMCKGIVALLLRLRLIEPGQAVSNHDLSPRDLAAATEAGIRNQLIVLDVLSRQSRAGAEGLLWIIGHKPARPPVDSILLPARHPSSGASGLRDDLLQSPRHFAAGASDPLRL